MLDKKLQEARMIRTQKDDTRALERSTGASATPTSKLQGSKSNSEEMVKNQHKKEESIQSGLPFDSTLEALLHQAKELEVFNAEHESSQSRKGVKQFRQVSPAKSGKATGAGVGDSPKTSYGRGQEGLARKRDGSDRKHEGRQMVQSRTKEESDRGEARGEGPPQKQKLVVVTHSADQMDGSAVSRSGNPNVKQPTPAAPELRLPMQREDRLRPLSSQKKTEKAEDGGEEEAWNQYVRSLEQGDAVAGGMFARCGGAWLSEESMELTCRELVHLLEESSLSKLRGDPSLVEVSKRPLSLDPN
ncbi:hypothetical protein GUITHDRAFT_144777 [Guillardia theta CCMP2712]|uniref:Uncharacterized protein n=1 Tax=Guillardia theta (strain CCMP2712) TaxID=905079 RepID=L1INI7_GUITC|nr:hypothetical protein GUITHDRAFT_144777 [Guillardia theta CCMP2712]EKX37813.1 hypothetical protein GUITHDRAFT_144777 [Guillardia theta CCMP2712]|eukprot:XP_005824793.1 hypothetical protein GUITHDRAFT_144777 [Guillardia theta CCMP2712]